MMRHRSLSTAAVALAILLVMLLQPVISASAAPGSDGEDVGFYVSAQIPDNQIDTGLTYFDLYMQPSVKQTLAVSIFNASAEDMTLDVSAISASTNQNGLIDYSTPNIRDETLLHPFSELAAVRESEITVAANGSATAYIDLEMPEQTYDGVTLGGIVIKRKNNPDNETTDDRSGGVIYNQYEYVLGVKLRETDTSVEPEFELFNVNAEAVNYHAAYVHYLRNKEAAIVKNMNVSLTINKENNQEVVLEDDWTIDMAPNSVIQLPAFTDRDSLSPGKYTSRMTLTDKEGGETIVLEFTFIIDRKDLDAVNSEAIDETNSSPLPLWAWVIITLLTILILLVIMFLILFIKRRKKEEDETGDKSYEIE